MSRIGDTRDSKMALLAAPRNTVFCIAQKDESILHTKSDSVVNALRRIRKAETATGTVERLNELDKYIAALRG